MQESAVSASRPGASAPPHPPAAALRRLARGVVLWTTAHAGVLALFLAGYGWPGLVGAAVLWLLGIGPAFVLLRAFQGRFYPSATVRRWVFRPFWYVQLALPLLSTATVLGWLAGLPFSAGLVGARYALAVMAGLYLLVVLAGYAGTYRLVVHHRTFRFPTLPPALDGLRIVQLSDLHIGPHTSRWLLRRIAQAVEAAAPDLIVFTGDQVDDYAADARLFVDAFGSLRAPLGVWAIAGNHDIFAGWHAVRHTLESAGFIVPVNEARAVSYRGARFWVVGLGDPAGSFWPYGGGAEAVPDVARALQHVPDGAFVVALAHNPALWPELARRGVALTLSGHTHHGQVSIPALRWCLASPFVRFAMGCYRYRDAVLYVHPGSNYWGLPLRLGAWPEVTVITLRRGPSANHCTNVASLED
ncbi:metallophosphoesterase [Rhodothermus marinus]|uniref:metallophosphoesterase n=1 Tax=Rhodothermus marinus TaxID=29549 RepID=UPI0012BA4E94|nr:metallophosphoesterase [Rhodothermus marinus]BBM68517.1 hypothetical protein RmaAA213_03630 [Rhodothermus marinus]BBM71485.1 hypothetical protein RmaAA338_03500 [Rhodothermus marinus]